LNNGISSGDSKNNTFVIVSIILVVSLIANVYLYSRQSGLTPESEVLELHNQIDTLTDETKTLQNQTDILTKEKNSLQTQINNLTIEVKNLQAPKLVTRIISTHEKPLDSENYLHLIGSVINVGTNNANNCRLHVILFKDGVVAIDTDIDLGEIRGEGFLDIDKQVFYTGSEIIAWSIEAEWD
jgi:hypothetical protein